MPVTEIIRKKMGTLPHKPGIYLMKDRFGTVIYVGKARDLRKRVSQYFHPSRRMGWDLKFNALVEAICDFDFHVVRSEPEALLLEGKLIKEFHPRYNVSFRDDKRFLMLKVNLNDPIPNFTFTRFKQGRWRALFRAVLEFRRLAQHAGAGAAAVQFARLPRRSRRAKRDYKHCLYAHLKYCTAPCIGNVTREQYLEQVRAACDFLDGQCEEMKEQLEVEMKKAALAQDYEKAAGLRDLIRDLGETTKKERKFERVPYTLPLSLDPENDLAELAKVLGLPQAAAAHRRVRHLEHQRHVRRGVAGEFQERPARPRELSPVQNQNRRRPGRFRQHGGGGAAAVYAVVERVPSPKSKVQRRRW